MTRNPDSGMFRDGRRGNASLQSVMILALAALILTALRLIWAPGPGGSGGLMAQVEGKFETIFNGGNDPGNSGGGGGGGTSPGDPGGAGDGDDGGNGGSGGNGTNGDGSGGSGSGGSDSGDGQQDGDGTSGKDDDDGAGDDSGDDDDDKSPDDGSGDPDDSGDDQDKDPDQEPDDDDSWENYADIAMAVALESSKAYGQKIIDDAKVAALKQVAKNDPLLEAFGMSIRDFQIESPGARAAAFRGAGVMVDAVVGVDGLIQGDRKVKELAQAGDYRGAWRTTWSTPAKFIADTIFASKAVDVLLSRLPTSAQIAVKVGVPEAVEGAAGAAADVLFDPVATRINAGLWNLYDRGLVPRPRMPRP